MCNYGYKIRTLNLITYLKIIEISNAFLISNYQKFREALMIVVNVSIEKYMYKRNIIESNSLVPLRFLKLHDYPGVFGKRLGGNCLSLGSLARSNPTGGQAEIDYLPELVDLVLKISNGNISFFQSFFEHLDHLVATS